MAKRGKLADVPRLGDGGGNLAQPYFEVEVRGKKYKLCFTFRALARATRQLREMGVTTNLSASIGNIDFDNIVPLTLAALATYHGEMSFVEAEALVDFDTMPALREGIQKAFIAAFAKVEDGKDKADPPEAAPQSA